MKSQTGGVILLCLIWSFEVHGVDVTCMTCQDVPHPRYCNESVICGKDEICFTRGYTNHRGAPAFRLGCEGRSVCQLLKANSVIGKRGVGDVEDHCYECCAVDDCNKNLCHGSSAVTLNTTFPPKAECPDEFIAFKDSCYLFETTERSWPDARSFCQGLQADLLTIHSKEENDFIAKQLNSLTVHTTNVFWIGGKFSDEDNGFKWVDGSSFDYKNWYQGRPPPPFSESRLVIGNPSLVSYYDTAPILGYHLDRSFDFICKKTSLGN